MDFDTSLNNDGTTDVSVFVSSYIQPIHCKIIPHQDSQLVYYAQQDLFGSQLDFNVAHSDLILDYTKDVTVRIEINIRTLGIPLSGHTRS